MPKNFGQKGLTRDILNKLKQIQKDKCCIDPCVYPVQDDFELPFASPGAGYSYSYQLHGEAPFQLVVLIKPDWLTITLDEETGIIEFSGTPSDVATEAVEFAVTACGRNMAMFGQIVVSPIFVVDVLSLQNFDGDDVTDYRVGVFNVNQVFLGDADNADEYAALWNADPDNAAVGSIEPNPSDGPVSFIYIPLTNAPSPPLYGLPYLLYTVKNFLGNPTPSIPFAMFKEDESFVSFAGDMSYFVDAWNADTDFSDVALARLINLTTPEVALYLKTNDPVPDLLGLRYWSVFGTTGSNILLSPGTFVVKGDSSVQKSDTGTLGDYSDFGLNVSSYGAGGNIALVDLTSVYYRVPLVTGSQNYICHNEAGEWAWLDVFGAFTTNTGYLPPTVRHLAIQSFGSSNITQQLKISNFLNYPTALENVEAVSFNGAPVFYDKTWLTYMPNLKTFQLIDTLGTLRQWADLGISNTLTPNLEWFTHRRNNSGAGLSSDATFWNNLPALTKGIDIQGVRILSSALTDEAFIGAAQSLEFVTPIVGARLRLLSQNAARTAASNAAAAFLAAKGYAIS